MGSLPNPVEGVDDRVNILIVDDRPDKLLAYEAMLGELNQKLVQARSGFEALRCLLREDFAVILLDVNMPGMDGFETASMIRRRLRSETTPIIFISAVNDTETHVSRGYSLGAVDYMLTPVVPEILRAKIAVFVDLYKKTEQVKRQAEERAKYLRDQAARAEVERRHERASFLAEASNILASSLEMRQTFQNLADLVVPKLADFCVIFASDDRNALRQVAIAHTSLSNNPALQRATSEFPTSAAAQKAAEDLLESGKPVTCCDLSSGNLNQLFTRTEDRDFVRSLEPNSCSAIPIRTMDRTLGVLLMFSMTAERACGEIQLSMAEELAQRAALALENGRLYKAAQEARTDAERANLAKDHFLAMLSHELRTPLTPVLTSLLAMEDHELPQDVRASLEMIRRNVELEARLIDDLLDVTRIRKGKLQLSLEIVNAHVLLRNALEICQTEILQKQIVLDLKLEADRVHIQADSARLQQVFWNLIKNAVKFTPNGGQLTIRTANNQDDLIVAVTDTGCGIAPKTLHKIFNAFEQGEWVRQGGLGLGLAISKALVEAHNGTIAAASPGLSHGATFTAVFPLSSRQTLEPSIDRTSRPVERKSLRILLVEDHEDTNRSLTQLLRRRGYEVMPAFTIANAMELANQEHFDVLVSDIGLPDGSGVELMQRLHSTRPVFGIALTGFGMADDIQRSRAGGFAHHLVKPIDLNRLDALIQGTVHPSPGDLALEVTQPE